MTYGPLNFPSPIQRYGSISNHGCVYPDSRLKKTIEHDTTQTVSPFYVGNLADINIKTSSLRGGDEVVKGSLSVRSKYDEGPSQVVSHNAGTLSHMNCTHILCNNGDHSFIKIGVGFLGLETYRCETFARLESQGMNSFKIKIISTIGPWPPFSGSVSLPPPPRVYISVQRGFKKVCVYNEHRQPRSRRWKLSQLASPTFNSLRQSWYT